MQDIRELLESLGLARYASAFEQNAIDGTLLAELNDQVLKDIGIGLAGHRLKILSAARVWASAAPTAQRVIAPVAARGAPSPPEGERRQLTVLFCDLVGFTELASRVDPEILQHIVRAYEDACAVCITRYEGYVFQRLGDGIVAFFGFPLAHEGEAERAIHAGLAILDSLAKLHVPEAGPLRVRIGIATGLVVVSSAEKGAVGETMNLASRLQGIAAVNTLVVSERVRRLAAGAFDYEDLGEQTLKGMPSATRAYRVVGVSQAQTRFEAATQAGLTAFVGREQEVGLLLERWKLSQEGEGQGVLLSGEAGIGKSRILSTLREGLERAGAQTLRYQCSPYHTHSAYHPMVQHIERALGLQREDTPEAKLDKLEAFLVTEHQRPRADVRLLGALLSLPGEARYGALQMSPQKQKDETLRALVDLIDALARRRPTLLLFEDLHWADPTSLEVLSLLVDRVRTTPLLSVFTHRPEFQNPWTSHGHVTSLNLSKLSRAQSATMIHALANHKALPGDLLEKILHRTDGIPLFVEELTRAILESKELEEKADRYEYKGDPAKLIIPATLRDSLMARLDRHQAMKEIAQMGAVIGREFSHELIEAVSAMPTEQLHSALAQLTNSGLAHRRGTPPEAIYTFKHALVQDAAYDSLLKSRRQALHIKIARTLESQFPALAEESPELVAHHYTEAGLSEQAVTYWKRAGELAHNRIALEESIAHLERGLSLTLSMSASRTRDQHELELRARLGMSWIAFRGWSFPAVAEHVRPAYALEESLSPGQHSLRVLWGLWVYLLATAQPRKSLPIAQELLAQGRSRDDEDMLQAGLWAVVTTSFWLGEFDTCIAHADLILESYDPVRHRGLASALNHDPKTVALQYKAASLGLLGYPEQAERIMHAAIDHANIRNHAFDYAWALYFAIAHHCYRQRDPHAIDRLQAVLMPLAKEQRLLAFEHLLGPMGDALREVLLGSHATANAIIDPLISALQLAALRSLIPEAKVLQAQCIIAVGDPHRAVSLIDEALEIVLHPDADLGYLIAEALRIKGLALAALGNTEAAEAMFQEAIDEARARKAMWWVLRAGVSLARLWQSQGKLREARDLLAPIVEWFTEGLGSVDVTEAKSLLIEIERRS